MGDSRGWMMADDQHEESRQCDAATPSEEEEGHVSKKMEKKMANKLKRRAAKQAYKQQQKQVMENKGQKMLPKRIQPCLFAKDKPMRSCVLWYPEARPYSRR